MTKEIEDKKFKHLKKGILRCMDSTISNMKSIIKIYVLILILYILVAGLLIAVGYTFLK